MAGFGWSITDILTVSSFAWNVYKSSKHAGEELFKSITEEVKSLQVSLHELNDEAGNPASLIHRSSEAQKKDLKELMKSCQSDLQELEELLLDYKSLKSSTARKRDRIAFSHTKQAEIRAKISKQSDRIDRFLQHLHTGALARIEVEGERRTHVLGELKAKLEALHQDVIAGRKDPSVLTNLDDWETLENELIDENISEVDVKINKREIFEWLEEICSTSDVEHEWTPSDGLNLFTEKALSIRSGTESWSSAISQQEARFHVQPMSQECSESPRHTAGDSNHDRKTSGQISIIVTGDSQASTAEVISSLRYLLAERKVEGVENFFSVPNNLVLYDALEVTRTETHSDDITDDARPDTSHDSIKTFKALSTSGEHNVADNKEKPKYERVQNSGLTLQTKPQHLAALNSCDIHHIVDISLCESICGWTRTIETIDQKSITVSTPGPTGPDWRKTYPGLGMQKSDKPDERGDLTIGVRIHYPSELTVHQKDVLGGTFD